MHLYIHKTLFLVTVNLFLISCLRMPPPPCWNDGSQVEAREPTFGLGKQKLGVFRFAWLASIATEQCCFTLPHTLALGRQLPSTAENWELHTNRKHACKLKTRLLIK